MAGLDCGYATSERSDVVVIGGGPAGSATALQLARRGFQVIQIEQRRFLQPGADLFRSGEALIPRARRELAALGLSVEAAPWACDPIWQARICWPSGHETHDSLTCHDGLLQINREILDCVIWHEAARAGVDSRESCRAYCLHRESRGRVDGVIVQRDHQEYHLIQAPIVVDAGGRNALTIRETGARLVAPDGDFFGMAMFFDQVAGLGEGVAEMHLFDPQHLTIVLLSRIQGGIVRCGLGTSFQHKRGAERSMEAFFWSRLRSQSSLIDRFSDSCIIRQPFVRSGIGYRVPQAVFDGLLLVGDAAGYPSPLLGNGMLRALLSARRAATVIERAAGHGDFSARGLASYARWHAAVDRRDRIAHAVIQCVYQHPSTLTGLERLNRVRRLLLLLLLRN